MSINLKGIRITTIIQILYQIFVNTYLLDNMIYYITKVNCN